MSNVFKSAFSTLKDQNPSVVAMFEAGDRIEEILLDLIIVKEQQRKEFEDDEHTIAEIVASIEEFGLLHPVVVMQIGDNQFRMVAGERRLRAFRKLGRPKIRALIKQPTNVDDLEREIRRIQFAENNHRKNLTQFELAATLQEDLDRLGSVDAVLAEHNIARPKLTKLLSLLKLPPMTQSLVTESVSADLEVLYTVGAIEKKDPEKAKTIVAELKRNDENKGKSARSIVNEIKNKDKPPKATAPDDADPSNDADSAVDRRTRDIFDDGPKAEAGKTPRSRPANANGSDLLAAMGASAGEPGHEPTSAAQPTTPPAPKGTAKKGTPYASESNDSEARTWFDKGHRSSNTAAAVLKGLREGTFGMTGEEGVRLAAFLSGADAANPDEFSIESIMSLV